MNNSSIGIIFFEFINKKIYLYIKKNNKEFYEDIIDFSNNDINIDIIFKNISPIYKSYNFDKNHVILILNKNKYDYIYNKFTNLEKINLDLFNNKNIHKYMKHNRIKYNDLCYVLENIKNIYLTKTYIK